MERETIERLEEKIETLTEIVKVLSMFVREIYLGLNLDNESQTEIHSTLNQTSQYDTSRVFRKDTINWTDLLKVTKDTTSEKFVVSVYQNNYPTVTEKQYLVLQSIGEKFNINLSV